MDRYEHQKLANITLRHIFN